MSRLGPRGRNAATKFRICIFSRERERGAERELPEKEIGVKGYRVVPPLDLPHVHSEATSGALSSR